MLKGMILHNSRLKAHYELYLSFSGTYTSCAELKKKLCAVTVAHDMFYLKEAVSCGRQP